MITYSPPSKHTEKLRTFDDQVLENLTKSIINESQVLKSASIISPSSSFCDRWTKKTEMSGLAYHRSESCHNLLRSPQLLSNHLFIIGGELPECSVDMLQQLIGNRLAAPFSLFNVQLDFRDIDIDRFNSVKVDLDLMMRINKITNAYLGDETSDITYDFTSSNRVHTFEHHTRKLKIKKDLIDNLKDRLSISPEDFLESAIQEIKTTKRGT
ncbi:MAG: hypothetical protein P8N49_04565 [Opitutales bacterium]|nr:hypothetical protein [Opitutales bacterium]